MTVGIEHAPHLKELEIAFELGRKVGLGEVEPVGAGGRFLLLFSCQPEAPKKASVLRVKQSLGSE